MYHRFRIRIGMHASLNKDVCDRSAAHRATWQNLELIFRWLLQHVKRRTRREREAYASLGPAETFMRACLRPTEAACFRIQKCANNRQLMVVIIQRFVWHAYIHTTHCVLSMSYIHAKHCVRYVYNIRKQWLAYFSYTEMLIRLRVLHDDEICFTFYGRHL